MSAMIGRIYFRRNLAYHVYGVGRRSYPLRAHASSQSLCRCKELAPLIGDMNYSHNPRYSNIQTLHSLDIRQMSTIRSCLKRDTSEIPILNCTSQGIYILSSGNQRDIVRFFATGPDPSSKVEETVRRLKEKHEQKLKQIHKIQDIDERVKSVIELDQETDQAVQKIKEQAKDIDKVVKKSLWQRFVDELRHYKSGFVLLFLDVRVTSKIIWKMVRGNNLTRRENRQLVRTVGDLFRLVPFSVFVIVPFMEFLLPVALKLFPGMLPSTFTTKSERENKFRQKLVAKIEYAKFLQKTLDEMAPTDTKDSRSSQSARDFVAFYKQIRESGKEFDNEQILKFSKLFEDDITLDSLSRGQLAAICRMLELPTVGTKVILEFSIEMRLRNLKADDKIIRREGVENMTVNEMQQASKERGMRALGLPKEQLIKQLKEWLDLSLNAKVPPSLLLLSRTLYLPQTLDPISQLAATISTLPESAASRASAGIASKEGKTRNVDKLELIKEEQKKIEEEAKEEQVRIEKQKIELERKEKAAQALLAEEMAKEVLASSLPPTIDVHINEPNLQNVAYATREEKETLVDHAPIVTDITSAKVLEAAEPILKAQETAAVKELTPDIEDVKPIIVPLRERELSAEDFSELKVAIEKLGKVKSEVETVDDIKKELEEYKEDVENLQSVKEIVQRSGLKESKGAQRLFAKVNKMLRKVDKKLAKSGDAKTAVGEEVDADDSLVTINELIKAVQTSDSQMDSSKVEAMIEVLGLMDEDSDGVVKVDHIMKVIELLGTVDAKLPAKEIRQIVDMLAKEDLLQVEENIEQSMALHSETDDSFRIDAAYDQDLTDLEAAAKLDVVEEPAGKEANAVNEELKSIDMDLSDEKYNIQDNAKIIGDASDVTNSQPEKIFSDDSSQETKHHDEEPKSAQVKLSDAKKTDKIDLK